ncbi:histone-lysine N-methyltransferase set1-like isoform X1 [Odontomachus brunneus]|uniref:histone-lysine N-methyltransferase set1-like isoform X1 n=1 Tax=Odontomachus brunneus TaxID=486640 RepID=UPI0013F1B7A6|nr:histone-lysine N-methyltransferase set1-like isoform X1 [Odontomachus brunneus]XP_032667320.1 histone-lysine N-methyltransferase set1-like isoform X1 [Odontomachus brunneus]XP_032667321.1 histone-lysine N-methyltransferase set1-like isoform X1 [Odontomachus brunneus]
MTVTPSTSDVADKAVSTDDGGSGMEVARLEAVLAALVETKVEAMKASSTLSRRSGSAPASPRRPRLTSTSTASSSLNHHHHHHHHHHHQSHHHPHSQQQQQQQQQQQYRKKGQPQQQHHRHRRRRHDSAPCGEYLNSATDHSQHKSSNGKGRRRASESPRSPRKKRKHSRSPNVLQGVQDVHAGLDSRLELVGIDGDQNVALINFERAKERAKEVFGDSSKYPPLHRSACYISQSEAQLNIPYDDADYVALNVADEEEETLSGPEKVDELQERYHRPRRKRKRKRCKVESVVSPEEELVDPEELPPRARWTIVVTACLLLAMSLFLVGVTLRMAPIIDDMVRKENEELLNSLNRDNSVPENVTAPP